MRSTFTTYGYYSSLKSLQSAYSSATTTRLGPLTQRVHCIRLLATTDCHIRFGSSSVTGTTSSGVRLSANIPEYFTVPGSSAVYVSAIKASGASNGTVFLTEMSN